MKKNKNKYLERTMEFHKIYQDEIMPMLKGVEPRRKELQNKIRKHYLILSLLYLIIVVVFPLLILGFANFGYYNWYLPALWILCIIVTIYLTLFKSYKNTKFFETLKERNLHKILRVFGDISWVKGGGCISDIELKASALFPNFNERADDDGFIGSYNGVDFRILETELIAVHQTKNGEERERRYKGIILSFESNKEIKNRTMVATKGDITAKNAYLYSIFPIFCIFMRIILEFDNIKPIYLLYALLASLPIACILAYVFREKEKEPLDEVVLEDSRFCKRFNVYSSDQVEARYLVTTSFMERLQNLKTAFGAKKVKCSFFGNQIMFAISTKKNLFEIANINTPLTDPRTVNELYDELSAIYQMIDYFKLDEKTGL